jgi:signal transduction histidine kinase
LISNNFNADHSFIKYLLVGLVTNPITAIVFATTFKILIPKARPLAEPKLFGLYILVPITLNTAVVSLLTMTLLHFLIEDFPIFAGWQQWWYSDVMGLLIFATPILMIASSWDRIEQQQDRTFEAALTLVGFAFIVLVLFTSPIEGTAFRYYKLILMLPIYAWIVSRFGAVVMALTTIVLTLVVLAALVYHVSPFESSSQTEAQNVLAVQGFLLPATLTVLFVASILEHRKRQYEALLENERQMRALSHVEALGTMAGGVAHDFGNLAIAARAYLSVLKSQIKEPNQAVRQALSGLEESMDNAQSLTKSLMLFAREDNADQSSEPARTDLCQAVEEAIGTMGSLISPKYNLTSKIPDAPIYVQAHNTDLQRILSNLIINARDASEPGQRIDVSVAQEGHGAWLLVSDQGKGIPKEIQERVFDPFFTTKPRGQGTGLGLAVVSGIVRELNGEINLASTPGAGTTVALYFPMLEDE